MKERGEGATLAPSRQFMDYRNGELYGTWVAYPLGIRRETAKLVQCPLGPTFEALVQHFERCAEMHGGCAGCPGRTNGCVTMFDRMCAVAAARKLSRTEAEPDILAMLERVGGYRPHSPEKPAPATAVDATRRIIEENANGGRKIPG